MSGGESKKDKRSGQKPKTLQTELPVEPIENMQTQRGPFSTEDMKQFITWTSQLYSLDIISDQELSQIYENAKYKGFQRDDVLRGLYTTLKSPKIVIEAIICCALRGPKAAQNIIMSNGQTLRQMGIPGSGGKGKELLTCNKIVSATADLAAYYLKKLNVPKRIHSHQLPSWLQFPSAGSIRMSENMRELHIDFSRKFSKVILGEFNENIYSTMVANAYLDDRLNLFQ